MTIVSYRIYCDSCDANAVIRERDMDDSSWNVNSKVNHSGTCPECNPSVNAESASESREDDDEAIVYEEVNGIGAGAARSLERVGLHTRGDVRTASDERLLDVSHIGQSKVDALRKYVG